MKAQIIYTEENVTPEWLRHIAKQVGEVWIENRGGELVIVLEFGDKRNACEKSEVNPG